MDNLLNQICEDQIGGSGDILDQFAADECLDEYPDFDEPWDELLAQQELEDFEQADEYFGCYGDEW